jgi:prephenate dehydratase
VKKIAYLGPKGSNSDQAVQFYANKTKLHDFEEFPTLTIEDAILLLENQGVDEAVVPIENSVEGSVNVTLDKLAQSPNLMIAGELLLPIRYVLMAKRDTNPQHVKKIASHPQSIAQCRGYIRDQYPLVEIVYTNSTSEAAQIVYETQEDMLAICSTNAMHLFDLDVVDRNIQDFENNATRFVVLTQKAKKDQDLKDHKCSIVFSSENKPGRLYEVLEIFKNLQVNLTKIESRPSKRKIGEYIFFADMEMNQREDLIAQIHDLLKYKTSFLKFLGAYPVLSNMSDV